eukprot:29610_1
MVPVASLVSLPTLQLCSHSPRVKLFLSGRLFGMCGGKDRVEESPTDADDVEIVVGNDEDCGVNTTEGPGGWLGWFYQELKREHVWIWVCFVLVLTLLVGGLVLVTTRVASSHATDGHAAT